MLQWTSTASPLAPIHRHSFTSCCKIVSGSLFGRLISSSWWPADGSRWPIASSSFSLVSSEKFSQLPCSLFAYSCILFSIFYIRDLILTTCQRHFVHSSSHSTWSTESIEFNLFNQFVTASLFQPVQFCQFNSCPAHRNSHCNQSLFFSS